MRPCQGPVSMDFAALYLSPRVGCSASGGGGSLWWRDWGVCGGSLRSPGRDGGASLTEARDLRSHGWPPHSLKCAHALQDFCDYESSAYPAIDSAAVTVKALAGPPSSGLMTQAIAGSRGLARNQWLTSPLSNVSHHIHA